MEKTPLQKQLESKLDEVRKHLLGEPDMKDLERMQLQIDLLERAVEAPLEDHSHDTSEHHDHVHSIVFQGVNPVERA